jgi:PAS domain S-box-containing protein
VTDLTTIKEWLAAAGNAADGLNSPSGVDAPLDTPASRQATLRDYERFFAYIFDHSPDGISVLDTELNVLGVNRTMQRWFAHKGNIVGQKCYQAYHDRDAPCERCPTIAALRAGRPQVCGVPYDTPAGRAGTQELSAFPVFDEDERVVGIVEYVRDVTQETKKEEAVSDLKRRLRFQSQTLQDQERALEMLIRREGEQERRTAASVAGNVNIMVWPLVDKLKRATRGTELEGTVDVLASCIEEVTSPLVSRVTAGQHGLTPREAQVAELVRRGRPTKEIADVLAISEKAVEYHRMKIRRKLGLSGTATSLQAHLSRLAQF